MANKLVSKWARYYEENGLQWLASQHVAAIKQAFFAGADAVEQLRAPDGACAHPIEDEREVAGTKFCGICGKVSPRR